MYVYVVVGGDMALPRIGGESSMVKLSGWLA